MKVIRKRNDEMSMSRICGIVRSKEARNYFEAGDQIALPWENTAEQVKYMMPFDIVDFRDVELEDGSTVPGMTLQMHYTLPFSVPFAASCSEIPNSWEKSVIRQYLNSDRLATAWWEPKSQSDKYPDIADEKDGMLTGFDEEFLEAIKPVKVTTIANDGKLVITYDRFFLPSLSQVGIRKFGDGELEGSTWEYWAYRCANEEDTEEPFIGLEGETCSFVRLRSAYRTNAISAWIVTSAGRANYISAAYAGRFCAACTIC